MVATSGFIFNGFTGYSNPGYDTLAEQLDALGVDWNAPGGNLDTIDPRARSLLYALQVIFAEEKPMHQLFSHHVEPSNWEFLWFNFNSAFLTNGERLAIGDAIDEEDIVALRAALPRPGVVNSFQRYLSPYVDPDFEQGGPFSP